MAGRTQVRVNARGVAAEALALAAGSYPQLDPSAELATAGLRPRDARLAVAIHRTALRRWITLEYFLNISLAKPMRLLEPGLCGVLLSAAAQLLFFSRIPVHAVVDESVQLARTMVRPGAAALANAVLRRLGVMVAPTFLDLPWTPAPDRLPLEGGCVVLASGLLPSPASFIDHMHVATSHPKMLIQRWVRSFGLAETQAICLHNTATPPTVVVLESDAPAGLSGVPERFVRPHAISPFVLWRGGHDRLVALLGQNQARRVQDPASARPVAATAGLSPRWCVDYCAGRGTKTRQIAALHPGARVVATDASADRVAGLQRSFAGHGTVSVVDPDAVAGVCPRGGVDLLVLDVPCTNTAVLARRPKARYRFSEENLQSLVQRQRLIIESAIPLLRSGGYVLYSTCSLEKQENQDQADWMVQRYGAQMVSEQHTLPAGMDAAYHDGSYHALLRLPLHAATP